MNVNTISNIFKTRYEILKENIKIDNKYKNNAIMMSIDIGHIMRLLFEIIERKNLIITKKDRSLMFVSIINIVAHYRHFFHSILKIDNTFVLYCGNTEDYDEFSDIITDLYDFGKFIPNFIVIPKNKTTKKYHYYHILAYIINYAKTMCDHEKKKLNLFVLASQNDYAVLQIGNICDKTYYLNSNLDKTIITHDEIWNKKLLIDDERFKNIKYSYFLNKLLFPYLIYFRKITDKDHIIESKNNTRYETRTKQIFEFIDLNSKSIDIVVDYGKFLNFSEEDIKNCRFIMNELLYQNNPGIKNFIKDLIKSWNQKLHDKKLNNVNEFYDLLSENNIIILWLNECKG